MNLKAAIQKLQADPRFQALTQKIQADHPTFTWTRGGCFAFAEAVSAMVSGSELWAVGQYEKQANDWPAQHAFVKYQGKFYDATGEVSEAELLKKYSDPKGQAKLGAVNDWAELWYPEQEFVNEKEMTELAVLIDELGRP